MFSPDMFASIGAIILHFNEIENLMQAEMDLPWIRRKLPTEFELSDDLRPGFRSQRKEWGRVMRAKIGNDAKWLSALSSIVGKIIETREWRDLLCHAPIRPSFDSLETLVAIQKTENPKHIRLEVLRWLRLRREHNQPILDNDYQNFRLAIEQRKEVERSITAQELSDLAGNTLPNLTQQIRILHYYTSGFMRSEEAYNKLCQTMT